MAERMPGKSAYKAMLVSGLLLLSGLPMLAPDAAAEAWTRNDMGKPYEGNIYYGLYGVAVGDGDRDSSNEVYVSSFDDATVYQYTYTDAGWVSSPIATGGNYLYKVIVGDGDDDGSPEVYATGYSYTYPNYGPMLEQIIHDDAGWRSNFITTLGYWTINGEMGDGNNDNRTEIYTSDYYGHIYQNVKGQTWDSQDIGNTTNSSDSSYANEYGLAIGDGDNDGKNEVYGSSSIGYVDRFAFDGSNWKRTTVGRGELNSVYGENYSMISAIKVGDADNDGSNEVYGVSWTNASVYRFSWDNSSKSWVRTTIAALGNWIYAYSVEIGDADGDGSKELYAGTYKQVYKVWYDKSTKEWRSTGVGGGKSYMYDLDIGSATGDVSQKELYSACLDGHAYQFYTDRTPPANPVVTSDTHPVPGTWYNKSIVHVLWKDAGYDISGIDGYSVAWDKSSKSVPDASKDCEQGVREANSTALADGNSWYFHIRARDNALNWNASAAHFGPICIDTMPPDTLSARLNGGASYTGERKVTVSVSATDPAPGSGVSFMSFSNDGVIWSAWEVFSEQRDEWDMTDARYGGNDSDGLKHVYVKVLDGAGNEIGPQKRFKASIYLDRVGPYSLSILINNGAEYATDDAVDLGINASDTASGIAWMQFSNDGIAWSDWSDWQDTAVWSLTDGPGGSASDGNKSVFFRAQDRAGNIGGPVKAYITLDRSAPEGMSIVINNGEEYATNATVELTVSATDPYPGSGLVDMTIANDVGSLGTWEGFSPHYSGWSLINGTGGIDIDGNKTVYVETKDRAGNMAGPVTGSIFLDRARPDPVKVFINGGATYATSGAVNLTLSAVDPAPGSGVYAMQFSDDATKWSDWEAFDTFRAYSLPGGDGIKTVHFRVKDRAGNTGAVVNASIILDTASPGISGVRVVGLTDTSAIIAWLTGEDADSAVEYGATTAYGSSTSDPGFTTAHSITLKGLKASTSYHFRVRSKDRAGNPPSYSGDHLFTTAATPDTSPPMISNIQVLGITDRLAVVSWSTNEPSDSSVVYGKTTAYGARVFEAGLVLDHSVILHDLAPLTIYHLRAESKDAAGNGPSRSEDVAFTTLDAPDLLPPVISNVKVGGISGRVAVVSWETNEPADGSVDYGNTSAYGASVNGKGLTVLHELTLTDLAPLTVYHFRVRSTDASGNGPSMSDDMTFSTEALPDTTAPAISKVRAEGVTDDAATLVWETDEMADSFAEFGPTTEYGTTSAQGTYTLQHSLLLQGLKADTLYHMRVRSTDPSGNTAVSGDFTFRTGRTVVGADRTPPQILNVQVTGITDKKAVVIWQTDELANSGVELGTTMAYGMRASDPSYVLLHSIVLEGLRPNTEYHLRVTSTDVMGNGPSASADFHFTTTSGPDTVAPYVSDVRVTNITNSSVLISWRTDEPATAIVDYGADTFYGRNLTSRIFLLNHSVQLTGLAPGVTYHFRVTSIDPSGNPSKPGADMTFSTLKADGQPPVNPPPKKVDVPFVSTDNPWPLIALVLGVVAVLGVAYAVSSRRARGRKDADEATARQEDILPLPRAGTTPPETGPEQAAKEEAAAPASTAAPVHAKGPTSDMPVKIDAAAAHAPVRTAASAAHTPVRTAASAAHTPVRTAASAAHTPVASPALETVEMEHAPTSVAAAALARSLPAHSRTPSHNAGASPVPLRHIRCPACKTRIAIFKEGPQRIECPGCGTSGQYRPKTP